MKTTKNMAILFFATALLACAAVYCTTVNADGTTILASVRAAAFRHSETVTAPRLTPAEAALDAPTKSAALAPQ